MSKLPWQFINKCYNPVIKLDNYDPALHHWSPHICVLYIMT